MINDNHADTDLKRTFFLLFIEPRLTGHALSQIQHHTFNNFNDFINKIQSLYLPLTTYETLKHNMTKIKQNGESIYEFHIKIENALTKCQQAVRIRFNNF